MGLDLKAKPGCCEEAAIGIPFYAPCNQPAVHIVGWKGRTDKAILMCEACADHNVRNRGGEIRGSVEATPMGGVVICDLCNGDFTLSEEKGGFIFGSKGVCPRCAPRFEKDVKKYNEEEYITARANDGESFRDFIKRYRGDDAAVVIRTFKTAEDFFEAMKGEE